MARHKVLLIEDNADDVDMVLHACSHSGLNADVVVIRDGGDALDYLFQAGRPPPDVVVLDLTLPRLGGLDVLRSIRNNPGTRRIPVVVLTSSSSDTDMRASYDLGANSFIRKPHGFEAFAGVIGQLERYWLGLNIRPPA